MKLYSILALVIGILRTEEPQGEEPHAGAVACVETSASRSTVYSIGNLLEVLETRELFNSPVSLTVSVIQGIRVWLQDSDHLHSWSQRGRILT